MAAASPRTWRGAAQRASRSTSLRAQSARFAVTGGTCRAYRRLLNLAPADRLWPAECRSGAGGGLCHLAGHCHRGELCGAMLDYF